jgi:atypical dual specificity phosphatase
VKPKFEHLWWAIDCVLAGMPMPYVASDRRMNLGGDLEEYDDELPHLHRAGIRALVCLLNLPGDVPVFESAGFVIRCWPVANGQALSVPQANAFVEFVDDCRLKHLPVAVFCEAGLGRTGTAISAYLIRQGKTAREAIAFVRSKEASAVETPQQIRFLEEFSRSHP